MVALFFHMLAYLALQLRDQLRILAILMLVMALAMLVVAWRHQRRKRPTALIIPFPQRRQQETEQRRAA